MLILGYNDGSASLYQYDSKAESFKDTERAYNSDLKSKISGVCFSADGAYAVLGQVSNTFIFWNLIRD